MAAKALWSPSHSKVNQALPEIEVDTVFKGDQIHVYSTSGQTFHIGEYLR
jgi:hypothetical protein